MNKELSVHIDYYNTKMEPVCSRDYSLEDYVDMLHADLCRIISDVETLTYESNGNRSKEQWSDETWSLFCRIKHKLLDKAGEIKRQPMNLKKEPQHKRAYDSMTSFVADVADKSIHG